MTYGTFFTRIVGILAVPMFFVAARRYKADTKVPLQVDGHFDRQAGG